MLRNEDRVATHWRLSSIVERLRRSEPLAYKIPGMVENHGEAPVVKVQTFLVAKAEPPSERRFGEARENGIEVTHSAKVGVSTPFATLASSCS